MPTPTTKVANKEQAKQEAKKKPYHLKTESPFPEYPHPTAEECELVNRLLVSAKGKTDAPDTIPDPSLTVTGCGEVPSVLDALARTLLSSATSVHNAGLSFDGLVKRFGVLKRGIGKGSVNWYAVREASLEDVETAMISGGLAKKKAQFLKELLDSVYAENLARVEALLEQTPIKKDDEDDYDKSSGFYPCGDEGLDAETRRAHSIARLADNLLSLDHLQELSTAAAMAELTKYKGIGPKIGACVLLFCLRRPCFALDTHIFRITRWLGWTPNAYGLTEDKAFEHLDVKIPDHLKYSLHQQLFSHGQYCPRCRAKPSPGNDSDDTPCVIEHLVDRMLVKPEKPEMVNKDNGSTKRQSRKSSGLPSTRPKLPRRAKEVGDENKENEEAKGDDE